MNESKKKILVVIGATASGKSSVAHQLSIEFNGEIINADVMQCYKGIPIATNKPSEDEKKKYNYHLIDYVGPQTNYTVQQWVESADKEIEEISKKQKIPIICGGTSFYIDALLFRHNNQFVKQDDTIEIPWKQEEWYDKLKEFDLKMAERLHPNDTIRIKNALLHYLIHKKPLSETVINDEIEMRYDAIIVWVDASLELLDQRADTRVDKMVQQGMVEENMRFINEHEGELKKLDWKWGICMAIGLREFIECKLNNITTEEAIENVKIHTKQYIRKQLRWVKNRMVGMRNCQLIHFNRLDNDDSQINSLFKEVKERFEQNKEVNEKEIKEMKEKEKKNLVEWKKYKCEICGILLNGENEWNIHLKSKRHRSTKKKLKKAQELQRRKADE